MENFRKKLRARGGFTLIEMLIVVAIIAILVAVSIPLVNTSLEKTRVATDAANERAAKAAATVGYLSETLPGMANADPPGEVPYTTQDYFYDAVNGEIVKDAGDISKPYGKCTKDKGHKDMYIKVNVTENGIVTIEWVNKDGQNTPNAATHGTEI